MLTTWDPENPLGCPLVGAINAISGKWKPAILHMLSSGPMRFGALKRNIPPVSQRVLTLQLRELERHGLVSRIVEDSIPPSVTYHLTSQGLALVPVLAALHTWGKALDL